jgi:hypothetical protein
MHALIVAQSIFRSLWRGIDCCDILGCSIQLGIGNHRGRTIMCVDQIGAGMRRLFARPVILIGVVTLLVILLGCADYGALLHARIVPPPIVDIALGPYRVRSWVDFDPPCGAHPYCQGGPQTRFKVFYATLFIHNSAAPGALQMVPLVRLPLTPP